MNFFWVCSYGQSEVSRHSKHNVGLQVSSGSERIRQTFCTYFDIVLPRSNVSTGRDVINYIVSLAFCKEKKLRILSKFDIRHFEDNDGVVTQW